MGWGGAHLFALFFPPLIVRFWIGLYWFFLVCCPTCFTCFHVSRLFACFPVPHHVAYLGEGGGMGAHLQFHSRASNHFPIDGGRMGGGVDQQILSINRPESTFALMLALSIPAPPCRCPASTTTYLQEGQLSTGIYL